MWSAVKHLAFKDALTIRPQLLNTLSKFSSLRAQGMTDEQLKTGYRCDPTSKSNLRIIAKKDILVRLTRNLDKARGFVNGAIATVFEDLDYVAGMLKFVFRLNFRKMEDQYSSAFDRRVARIEPHSTRLLIRRSSHFVGTSLKN